MSDNEDFMMSEDDDNFEYEDSDEEMEDFQEESDMDSSNKESNIKFQIEKPDFENMYYFAKSMKDENKLQSLDGFSKLINYTIDSKNKTGSPEFCSEFARYKFKSAKQKLKILFSESRLDEFLLDYEFLFSLNEQLNDSLYFTDSLKKIIDRYTKNNENTEFVLKLVNKSLEYSNLLDDKLFVKLYTIKIKILSERDDLESKKNVKLMIQNAILKAESYKNYTKHQFLLEIYTIQLKSNMATVPPLSDLTIYTKQLEANYQNCIDIMSNIILHPKMLGIIKEAGGKIDMLKKDFLSAIDKVAESFKNYDEAGSVEDKSRILKILIVLNILAFRSEVSILQSNNIKPYLSSQANNNDKEITWLITLLRYYDINDISAFKDVLQKFQKDIKRKDSLFLTLFTSDMHNSINYKLLLQTFKVYSQVRFDYIIDLLELNNIDEIQDLIFEMISKEILTERISFNFVDKIIKVAKNDNPQALYSVISKSLDPSDVAINMDNLTSNYLISENVKINKDFISRFINYLQLGLFEKSKDSFTQNEVVQLETVLNLDTSVINTSTNNSQLANKILDNSAKNCKLSHIIFENKKKHIQIEKLKYNESKDQCKTITDLNFNQETVSRILDKVNDLQNVLFSNKELTYVPSVPTNDKSKTQC